MIYLATKTSKTIPWVAICRDIHVWAIVVGQIAHAWMFFTVNTDLPNFLKNVQGFDIKSNGLYTAMPFLAMWVFSIISGKLADVAVQKGIKVVTVRRVSTIIGKLILALLL